MRTLARTAPRAAARAECPRGFPPGRGCRGRSLSRVRLGTSSLDDEGARNLVVQALARLAEDHERVHQEVDRAHDGYQGWDAVHEVAQQEDPPERGFASIGAHDLDAADPLADRLAVAGDEHDG